MKCRDATLLASVGMFAMAAAGCSGQRADRASSDSATSVADSAATTSAPSRGPWIVTAQGAGPIRFGMSLAEVRAALGADSLQGATASMECGYVTPRAAPAGMRFMIQNGRVMRVDVDSAGPVTDRGAAVGTSAERIRQLYPDSLVLRPHKYDTAGRYLIAVPASPADSLLRVIFETDGQRVVRYRAGLEPAVEYVEGCG